MIQTEPRRRSVFVAGGTGYIGRRLVPRLLEHGHSVRVLARRGSESKVPAGCETVLGSPFDRRTFAAAVASCDTYIQLVGVAHPSPAKAQQFIDIDLRSAVESISAAREAGVAHFVYVSVAQPAPIMQAYQKARRRAEDALAATPMSRTIVRPWYVLGPGHRWPYLLVPFYWILEALPSTRSTARRLGLVTLPQMIGTLVDAVENPPELERLIEVPEIRGRG